MTAFIKSTIAVIFAVALFSTGCTDTVDHAKPPDYTEVLFTCESGEPVLIRFFPGKDLAVLVRDKEEVYLQQQPAGSGFFYTNKQISIRGKGNRLSMEDGKSPSRKCLVEPPA